MVPLCQFSLLNMLQRFGLLKVIGGGFVKSINRESGPDLGPEGRDCCVLWRLRMARGTAQGVDLGRGELPLASGVSSVGPSSSSPFSISTMVMAGGER
jgi:hypothetical protein